MQKSVNKLIRVLTADDELIHVSERQEQCFRSMKKAIKTFNYQHTRKIIGKSI